MQTVRWEPPVQVLKKYTVKWRIVDSCNDHDSSKFAIKLNEQILGTRGNENIESETLDADDAEISIGNEDELQNIVYVP